MKRIGIIVTALMATATLIIGTSVFAENPNTEPVTSGSWDDGWALISGYTWTGTRYRQERTGSAVSIYVAEPFSESKRVKVNDATANPSDTFQAIKLNLVRDFQTGIYDYNTMTSVFSRTDNLQPAKSTFSSAEWCGHVFENLRIDPDRISGQYMSYFEGESGEVAVAGKEGGILEDNLYILLRDLPDLRDGRSPFLTPGEKRSVYILPSAIQRRMAHTGGLEWVASEIERLPANERITVPAGTFDASVYVVQMGNGREGRFHVEREKPNRIVRWSWSGGPFEETAELSGSIRSLYWNQNREGDEALLRSLGIGS
jgi:hypothetical protein